MSDISSSYLLNESIFFLCSIDSIYDRIEQQSEQITDLNNKNLILISQLESADEVDQQK